jgi:hypothetical protein
MRTRTVAAVIGIACCAAAPARADSRAELVAKSRAAMASYDALDYEAARRLLYQALAIAKKAKLDREPIVARIYLELGIAELAGGNSEGAKLALLSAAQIDPKIAVEPAYRSPELVRLLDEAKAAAAAIDSAEPASDSVDCRALRGVQHTAVDTGVHGAPQSIEAWVGGDVTPARVAVMYRAEGAIDFTEARAARQGGCRYVATIPGSAARGSVVHYYIAAYDANSKVLAAKGSSGAPHAIEIGERARGTAGSPSLQPRPGESADRSGDRRARSDRGPDGADSADSGAGRRPDRGPDRGTDRTADRGLDGGAEPVPDGEPDRDGRDARDARPGATAGGRTGDRSPRLVVALSGGTGVGYVTGRTEGDNNVQSCCIGSSLVVLVPELGYHVSPRLTLGAALRLGFPIGANIAGHSTIAPAGLFRARYALADSGDGVRVMAELGAGILRNTIKLDDTVATGPAMDTDIVAQGPLLLGAGVGYGLHIARSVAFVVDLDAMLAIAVVGKLGTAIHLNTGVSADLSLGIAVGF